MGDEQIFGWWRRRDFFDPPSRVISVLITCAPESFLILFYIPKVILKFYVDGKLQIT